MLICDEVLFHQQQEALTTCVLLRSRHCQLFVCLSAYMGQRICIRWSIIFKYVTLSVSYVAREGSCHDSYFEAGSACARMGMHRAANLIHLVVVVFFFFVFVFVFFFFFAMLEVFLRAQCFL